jgi:maltose-binding protein MalE
MKRLLAGLTLLTSLAACSSPADRGGKPADAAKPAKPGAVPTSEPPLPREQVELTLWHTYRDAEAKALEAVVADWNASEAGKAARVKLEANPYEGFSDKLTAAIPRGNGPDLFIFAHDRVGGWAKSEILAPIQDLIDAETAEAFFQETLPPLEFKEQLYGLPLAFKSAVLFYNTALVKEPPKTTADMLALAKTLSKPADGAFGLAYPNSLLFYHSPWLFGFGGKVLDGEKPALDTPENAKSLEFAKSLVDAKVIPKEINYALATELFNSGKGAMLLIGPEFRGAIDAKIAYAVAPIPTVSETGKPAAPFLTVEAVLLSQKSAHKKEAFGFAKYLATEGAKQRLVEGKQSVAAKAAYDLPEAKGDQVLKVLVEQLSSSTPTPNIPEMNAVWTPFDRALEAVLSGKSDAAAALKDAQAKAEGR